MAESFICPRCSRVIRHPLDVVQRYCGACHLFHPPVAGSSQWAGRNRAEQVSWCKERALAELDGPGPVERRIVNALTSLKSDLRKHPDTMVHSGLELGALLALNGNLTTEQEVRSWIDGIQ